MGHFECKIERIMNKFEVQCRQFRRNFEKNNAKNCEYNYLSPTIYTLYIILCVGTLYCKCMMHVIVVTWARGICLICIPKTRGLQARGLWAYISDKSQVHMLQLICNISMH